LSLSKNLLHCRSAIQRGVKKGDLKTKLTLKFLAFHRSAKASKLNCLGVFETVGVDGVAEGSEVDHT